MVVARSTQIRPECFCATPDMFRLLTAAFAGDPARVDDLIVLSEITAAICLRIALS